MKKEQKEKLVKEFSKKNNKKSLIILDNEAVVTGTYVDEYNKLWYYIEQDGELKLERAKGQQIKQVFKNKSVGSIEISKNALKEAEDRIAKRRETTK